MGDSIEGSGEWAQARLSVGQSVFATASGAFRPAEVPEVIPILRDLEPGPDAVRIGLIALERRSNRFALRYVIYDSADPMETTERPKSWEAKDDLDTSYQVGEGSAKFRPVIFDGNRVFELTGQQLFEPGIPEGSSIMKFKWIRRDVTREFSVSLPR
jgi:hypothetical protein